MYATKVVQGVSSDNCQRSMEQLAYFSQKNGSRIIAAIPAYNVEQFIGGIIYKAKEYVDDVVVVDDGSTDNTAQVAEASGAQVVRHKVNLGAGEAVKSCFEAGRSKGADVLVLLDGDGQHNPEEIPQVLTPILDGKADFVIGSRFLDKRSTIPLYRKFGIRVITLLCNFASETKVSDSQSCFRAYNRKAIDVLRITERGFGFSVQLLLSAQQEKFTIVEVPISCSYHSGCHNQNPIIQGMIVALAVIRFRLNGSVNKVIENK